jgi:lysophospholipase L1-like esterase
VAFGDSLTWGTTNPPLPVPYRLDPGIAQSYPFKLQGLLTARYTDQKIEVFNFGIPGRQAAEDRDRFNDALSEVKPEVVLLMEGANDLNAPLRGSEGMNDRIIDTVSALEDMVRDATSQRVPVMLATLPPQREGGRRAGAAEYIGKFNAAVKAMAASKGALVVDINAGMPLALIGEDGLHPTEAGYDRMAEIWLEALKQRYETPGETPGDTTLGSAAGSVHLQAGAAQRSLQAPALRRRD